MSELTPQSTIAAFGWSYGGRIVQLLCQMGIGIVLARVLGPAPFGIVAAAWLIIGLANQCADFGLSAALVQRPSIGESDIRYVFTVQLLVGAGLMSFLNILADTISIIIGRPELAGVLRALSFVFLIQVFASVSTSLLKREMNFRAIQFAQVLSYAFAFLCIGIPLALSGFGAWSLVWAQLAQALCNSALLYTRVRHSITLLIHPRPASLVGFGAKVVFTNLLNWLISSIDSAYVARSWSLYELGIYNRAVTLTSSPIVHLHSALASVLFASYSRAGGDNSAVRQTYLSSIAAVSLLIGPLFAGVAVAHTTIVEGLFGQAWTAAAPLLVPMSIGAILFILMGLAGPLLWSKAMVEIELRGQGITLLLLLIVLTVSVGTSIVILAWSMLGVHFARFCLLTHSALRVTETSWLRFLAALRGAAVSALATSAAVGCVDKLLTNSHYSPALRLGPDLLLGIALPIGVFLAIPGVVLGHELTCLVQRHFSKMPSFLQPYLRHFLSSHAVI
jgi:lipopolysaccharide exporter